MRILFVDDEPKILEGLRRTLRKRRHEWDMHFVDSGAAALEFLADNDCDCIVSDMRMPEMTGAELLAQVKERHPQIIRIILSGHSEVDCVMSAIGVSHQYLSKPCDADILHDTIGVASSMRKLVESDRLHKMVGDIDNLPSVPETYQQLVAMLSDPDASVKATAKLISGDIGLTTNLLKTVNSAYFGLNTRIDSIERAITFVGLETLTNMVLGHGLFVAPEMAPITGFKLSELWEHSLKTAAICRRLAANESTFAAISPDDAFLAGMLHDVGKLVLASKDPEGFAAAIKQAKESGLSPEQAELGLVGASNAEIGAYLVSLWGFPVHIVEGVAYHERPHEASDTALSLAGVVHVADRLSYMGGDADAAQAGIDMEWLRTKNYEQHWASWLAQRVSADAEA